MNYPYLVNSAWYVLEKLVRDWQKHPYRFDRERDVQVELASRLSTLFSLVDEDTVEGNYEDVIEGFQNNQLHSRIACEPYVPYTYKDGNDYGCYPDVVIWDEIEDPNSPPNENWPTLWACEIKYTTNEPGAWDIEKLEYLIEQKRIRFGGWLTMRFQRAKKGNGLLWKRNKLGSHLWTCEAFLPAL